MDTIWWTSFCGNRSLYDAFWSYELSVNTSVPDITACLQKTVMTWLPCGFYIITAFIYLMYLSQRPSLHKCSSLSGFNIIKLIVSILMLLFTCVDLIFLFTADTIPDYPLGMPVDWVYYFIKIAALSLLIYVGTFEYMKGVISSGVQFLFLLFLFGFEVMSLRSVVIRHENNDPGLPDEHYTTYILYFTAMCVRFAMEFFADNSAQDGVSGWKYSALKTDGEGVPLLSSKTVSNTTNTNGTAKTSTLRQMPILRAPYWAKLTFMWVTGIVVRGYRKPFKFEDLFDLRWEEKCEYLVPKFMQAYYKSDKKTEEAKRNGYSGIQSNVPETRSIYYALWIGVGNPAMASAFFRLLSIPVMFVNPELLRMLIQFIVSGDPNTWKGLLIAALMLLSTFFYSIFINNFTYYGMVAGMRARTQMNAAVYRKALTLSNEAKRQTTVGQIVAVMSVDAQKVQDFFTYLSVLWSLPILVGLAIYFLYFEVGPSAFAGLMVLLVIIPINALYFARKAMQLQSSQMKQKDQRFRLLNEILSGIKVLKLYAWELSFKSTVLNYRERELIDIRLANYINAVGSMFWLLSPYMVSLAVYAVYSLTSPTNLMSPETVFVALSLINILNYPMSLLPMAMANTVQGIVSLRRVSVFLQLTDLNDETVERMGHVNAFPTKQDTVIEMKNVDVTWGERDKPILNNVNMTVKRGQLVAVVGTVGSGKSSLVQTILGELHKLSGTIKVGGSLAYVPQQAWIQFATVRENILFGKTDIPSKYNKIIDACALRTDLMILPGGDQTEIGEKGINLSGGQKQRVSLARAVYQNEDIYLLDDPLSAVDSHVGKHIFEKVIGPGGYLQDKTRILVTHGVTYLPYVDTIYVIKDGGISESGPYRELIERNGAFADFIRTYFNEEHHTSENEDEEIQELRSRFSESESGVDSDNHKSMRRRRSSRSLSRTKSEDEKKGIEDEVKVKGDKLIQDEVVETGNISISVFKKYIQAGGIVMFFLVVFGHIGFITSQVLTNIWLSTWSSDVPINGTSDEGLTELRLGVYGALGSLQVIFILGEAFALAEGCYAASRHLHASLLNRILHAPMSFFDTTPLGRVMNRFTKDVDVLDANMPMYVRQWLFSMAPVLTTLIIITYSTPIFGIVIIPLVIFFLIVQRMYITTARQLKRIESVKRSPLYVHFDESVVGATSIRAYRREGDFVDKADRLIDESQIPWFLVISSYRWCGVLMEFLGALIIFFASLFSVLFRSPETAGLAGLSVAYSLQIITYMNAMIQNASELENYVVSVERVAEYTQVEQEAEWYKPDEAPPQNWPDEGRIEFLDYCTRYREGLELVLRDINCDIKPMEKVGIIGRTGAGKSSLSLALFRLIESAAGRIRIDGMSIGRLGLHDLRSKISIIPQDPVVFSGTLRDNLDPFHQYSDQEVWTSLAHAHLKDFVSHTNEGLLYQCGEGGEAMSVGQRQLLCLARALLRNARILVLDEATAAVDLETDALIQETIRNQFKHCTIMTVAHRLNTVMDYDRIMVLDKGKIREFDAPSRLLSDRRTIFYGMARDAGLV